MKARFDEILREQCENWGVLPEQIRGKVRAGYLPAVRAKIIYQYKNEYPYVTWKAIGQLIGGMDHGSVKHLYDNEDNGVYKSKMPVCDFSSFMSTGYEQRIRFKYVDV